MPVGPPVAAAAAPAGLVVEGEDVRTCCLGISVADMRRREPAAVAEVVVVVAVPIGRRKDLRLSVYVCGFESQ